MEVNEEGKQIAKLGNDNAALKPGESRAQMNKKKVAHLKDVVVDIALKILEKPRVEMNEWDLQLWRDTYLKLLDKTMPQVRVMTTDDDEGPPMIQIVNYAGVVLKTTQQDGSNKDTIQIPAQDISVASVGRNGPGIQESGNSVAPSVGQGQELPKSDNQEKPGA